MTELFIDWRAWSIIILLALVTQVMSLAKYKAGQAGYEALIERYPQVPEERWHKADYYFNRWGSPLVFLSFLPVLAIIIPPAAGAFGVKLAPFLIFSFLAKIVSQLYVAGILQTSRGARGGVSLARKPEEISLLEVVEAIDGPIMLNECVSSNGVCVFGDTCPMRPVWCDAQAELVERLKVSTFDSFAGLAVAA